MFKHLGDLRPKNTVWRTLDFRFPGCPLPVRLEIRSSGRINADYTSAMLKLGKDRENEGAPSTAAALDAGDSRTLKLFARHIVVGWENVVDAEGKPMTFTQQGAEDLLLWVAIEQKSPDLVAPLIAYAAESNNFRDGDPETLGKR